MLCESTGLAKGVAENGRNDSNPFFQERSTLAALGMAGLASSCYYRLYRPLSTIYHLLSATSH